jgi:hypothetical protein
MRENILPASTEITLDGQAYILRYRAYAFIFYAEKTGRDLLADLREAAGELLQLQAAAAGDGKLSLGPVFAKIRDILWAGLADAHPEIQRDQVARLFGVSDLQTVAPLMMAAINQSLPAAPANPPEAAPIVNHQPSVPTDGPGSGPSAGTAAELAPPSSSS